MNLLALLRIYNASYVTLSKFNEFLLNTLKLDNELIEIHSHDHTTRVTKKSASFKVSIKCSDRPRQHLIDIKQQQYQQRIYRLKVIQKDNQLVIHSMNLIETRDRTTSWTEKLVRELFESIDLSKLEGLVIPKEIFDYDYANEFEKSKANIIQYKASLNDRLNETIIVQKITGYPMPKSNDYTQRMTQTHLNSVLTETLTTLERICWLVGFDDSNIKLLKKTCGSTKLKEQFEFTSKFLRELGKENIEFAKEMQQVKINELIDEVMNEMNAIENKLKEV